MARNLDIGALSSVGDVEVLERLGVGVGSGRFKARLGGGGPAVSLLLVESEKFDKTGLMDWARRLKRVDHPGVPGVLQIEDVLEPGFVAQRYVEGDTLDGRVERRGGPLPPVEALALVLQTAAALRAAHRNEIAHGALAPRSLVLEARDGAMDSVRLVGWRPLQAGLSFEKAVGRDLRALGEFLYLALAAVPAPGVTLADPLEPGAAVTVDFGDLADAWGRSGRGGGPGRSVFQALAAARRMATVDAFVDALLPEFSRLAGDALAEVAYELSADREFKAEVQRQRDRQRELESKLRFIRDWLRDNAPAIEVVDDRVAGLEAQERGLRNLEVELAMLLDRPVRAGAGTASPPRPRAPEPRALVVEPTAEPEEAEEPPASPTLDAPQPVAAGGGWGKMIAVAGVAAALAGVVVWFVTRPPEAGGPGGTLASAPIAAPDTAPHAVVPSKAPDSTAVSAPASAPVSAPASAPVSAPPSVAPATAAPAPATVAPETIARPLPPAPPGMVAIPGGAVALGLSADQRTKVLDQCRVDTAEVPKAGATLCVDATLATEPTEGTAQVAAFYIDRVEVSQLMYDRCVNQRGCKTLKLTWELDEQPATGVTWEMARQYCEHQGGRLPTLNEWMRAARGDASAIYAWGDEPPAEDKRHRANYGRYDDRRGPGPGRADGHKYAAPVGVYAERGASPFGIANLSDNVREWTSTEAPDGGAVVAGGGWRDLGMDLRVTRTASVPKDQYFNDLGFRCVVDLVSDR